MRLRTKLFLMWAVIMPVLWVPAFWSVQRIVKARVDQMAHESFQGAKQGLEEMQKERIARMRQAGRLMMSIPELRALIAEQNYELSAENVASLQERLDYLQNVVQVSFIAVLNRDRKCIAQSHHAPWQSVQGLRDYCANRAPPAALIQRVFRGREPQDGLWANREKLYHTLAIPLIFDADERETEGALILGEDLSASAQELGSSHNCEVTFLPKGAAAGPIKSNYRSALEQLVDPASGRMVGQMLIQRDMQDAQINAQLLRSLLLILVSGLAAAALASFLVSAAVTRPVQQLASGVKRVADGDLELSLPVKGKDELALLSRSFNEMVSQIRCRRLLERQVEEARAASAAKSQFLANMSHEIRTPLNGVIGMTELLLGTSLSEQQRRYAGLVKTSAELLTSQINDILDFSKIEAGRLEIECIDFDLHATVEEVIDLMSEKAGRKKLELGCAFDADLPRLVRGDPDRLRQILVNLVNNAIKFTQTGSVIVRVAQQPDPGESTIIRFQVTDTGIGIPPDRLDRLFKPFSQVDASTTRKFGGTGLGLAISKQLAELMGGAIGVESDPNRGSTFWFTVKLKKQPIDQTALNPVIDPRGFKVLAVDDSQATRAILNQQLTNWDLDAHTTGNATDALAALQQAALSSQPFKVAIIDSDMPGTNGFELARAIKSEASIRSTVLMVMLSMETVVNRNELAAAGFAGHLTKPVRQSQLYDAIMRAIVRDEAGVNLEAFEARGEPKPQPGSARGRILIAEDNEVNQIVAMELLGRAGYSCEVVDNGRKALEASAGGNFDLILMDCQMPEMDGFEATRLIRQREQAQSGKRIPIIALTANAIKGDRELCLNAGMDGYCSKPVDPKQLLPTIEKLMNASNASDSPNSHTEVPQRICVDSPSEGSDPPIHVETLIDRCMKNLTTINIVLGKFENQALRDVDELQQKIQNSDATGAAKTAHALKGAAAIVAAQRVQTIAAELEKLGRAQELTSLGSQLDELRDAVAQCVGYLPKVRQIVSERLVDKV